MSTKKNAVSHPISTICVFIKNKRVHALAGFRELLHKQLINLYFPQMGGRHKKDFKRVTVQTEKYDVRLQKNMRMKLFNVVSIYLNILAFQNNLMQLETWKEVTVCIIEEAKEILGDSKNRREGNTRNKNCVFCYWDCWWFFSNSWSCTNSSHIWSISGAYNCRCQRRGCFGISKRSGHRIQFEK